MFSKTAKYYDLIYGEKDYPGECEKLDALIQRENPGAKTILDVACGTAEHDKHLSKTYQVDGVDLETDSIEIACTKNPGGTYTKADMSDFDLGKTYDAILCLFSSIGYLTEPERVISALKCFKKHLNPGGVIFVEPWFTPEQWMVGALNMQTVDTPDVKICRMNKSEVEGTLSKVHFHYLIANPDGVEHLEEDHNLTLYTREEMLSFFEEAGLKVRHESEGFLRRGLYIGRG